MPASACSSRPGVSSPTQTSVCEIDEGEERQLRVAASIGCLIRCADVAESRVGFGFEGACAEQHVESGAASVIAADFREGALG
jgi:hypothetical protein